MAVNRRKSEKKMTANTNMTLKYIKVHIATRWTIRHGLMLLWFTDLMNVTEEVTVHRPNILTSAFVWRLGILTLAMLL